MPLAIPNTNYVPHKYQVNVRMQKINFVGDIAKLPDNTGDPPVEIQAIVG